MYWRDLLSRIGRTAPPLPELVREASDRSGQVSRRAFVDLCGAAVAGMALDDLDKLLWGAWAENDLPTACAGLGRDRPRVRNIHPLCGQMGQVPAQLRGRLGGGEGSRQPDRALPSASMGSTTEAIVSSDLGLLVCEHKTLMRFDLLGGRA